MRTRRTARTIRSPCPLVAVAPKRGCPRRAAPVGWDLMFLGSSLSQSWDDPLEPPPLGIALASSYLGDSSTAEKALADLDRGAPTAVRMQDVSMLRARAWSALVRGELRAAREILWEAVALAESWGQFTTEAEAFSLESRLASSAGLRRRASTADARAMRALQKCEGASALWIPRSTESSQLSDREREVALLASQNLTSREIAKRLFVSVRTVDNHLQQVYVKLGVKRRTDLAAHL